ncbi:hypothetical protein LCGC14_2577660 [marine sediment metagenome]|uniref:Uncharacterized protein n=1 Tax=marine sediment metagenome TaxID=412755 RepID=A0A0F9CRJ3_9ZZZZ
MGNVTSGIGAYKSILGGRLGITKDDELVLGGRVLNTGYAALGAGVPYYCDPDNGDNNLSGRTPGTAVASLVTALGLTTAEQNDAVVLIGDGNTTGTARLTAELDWAKDAVHLVGIAAPSRESQRARISHPTSAVTNFNLFKVSGSGCAFENFSLFQGVGQATTDEKLMEVTGSRNSFDGVAIMGIGATAGAARAGSYDLYLNGGGENVFRNCSIGVETIQRSAANANVRIRNRAQRNQFEDCDFVVSASSNAVLNIDADSNDALGGSTMVFKRCFMRNLLGIPSGVAQTVSITFDAANNGTIYVLDSWTQAAAWAAASARVQLANGGAAAAGGGETIDSA